MRRMRIGLLMVGLLWSAAAHAQTAARIDQLDWMTGNWAGAIGPNQLEENWIATEGGSIAALVRVTGEGATSMFEMITIEESDGTLVLHLQQFDPGFQPRTITAQEMVLEAISTDSVRFRAVAEGGMPSLGYSRPDADTFVVHVGRPDGSTLDIPLAARELW